MILSW